MIIHDIDKQGNVAVLALSGRLDAVAAPEFENRLNQLIDQREYAIVIDCGELAYISSAGLRSILSPAKKMKAAEGRLIVANAQESVSKVFHLSGIHTIIPLVAAVEEAVASLQ